MDALTESAKMNVQLYGFWRSIASFRVRVALRLKGIPFDEISVDILSGEQFKPDYGQLNAGHVVPTLVHDGNSIFQSLAIIEYLDEWQPAQPLLPADRLERARARMLALVAIADSHPLIVPRIRKHLAMKFGASDGDIQEWGRHWTSEGMATYERLLGQAPPAPFALGPTPGIADICIAGQIVMADTFKVDLTRYPITSELGQRCFALSAFADSRQSAPVAPDRT
jgi:maleylpyruvate isomerase